MRILVTGGSGFIGTNYVDLAVGVGATVCNVDRRPPKKASHKKYWTQCDILDAPTLQKVVAGFRPTHFVHLAARTGVRGSLNDFDENWIGTENLLAAVRSCASVTRLIVTSSALVCEIGYVPRSDTDYCPSTPYGRSKVEVERATRRAEDIGCCWTIIRPVSIWGPWGQEPYSDLFTAIRSGMYFHIGSGLVRKSLGYVGNVAHQIQGLLTAPANTVRGKTLYIADDPPVMLRQFAETIREELGAPRIRTIPRRAARVVAGAGDVLRKLGWDRVPLTSFRLNNILTEYVYDVSFVRDLAGRGPFDLNEGVRITAEWLQGAVWGDQ